MGDDKLLLPVPPKGTPLVRHVAELLLPLATRVVVVANDPDVCAAVREIGLDDIEREQDGVQARKLVSCLPDDAPCVGPIGKVGWQAVQGTVFAFEDRVDSTEPEKRPSLSRFIAPSFDISTFGVPGQGALSPFLGGGMGAVRTGSGEAPVSSSWDTGRFVPGASKIGTAWMVTAGVAATLGARTTVELSWRYNHLGEAKTGRGSGRVEWRERGQPIPTNLAPTSEEAKSGSLVRTGTSVS